ncbi:MAG: hypothetical protein FWH11_11065 [Micrococcales bacterium]|nr:hypothetical protein [Micrococcales bacterium]
MSPPLDTEKPDRPEPGRPTAAAAGGNSLAGTGLLLRFMLRRDRVRLGVWTVSVVALWGYVVVAFGALYSTPEERQSRAALMDTPASIMMTGPGYGLDDYSVGAMMANELLLWIVIALAVMSILEVVRHTRAEEESGRSELVRAGVVGRHAPAVAAMALVVVVNTAIAGLTVVLLAAGGYGLGDSLVLAAAAGLTAVVFGAVATVTCQLTAQGRGASGLAGAGLGLAVVVRAAGDIEGAAADGHGSALSWFSPVAWAQQTRVFVDTRAWPLALGVVAVVVLLALAAGLASHRDFGAGMYPDRAGRAAARAALRSPAALAWRQQRLALLWWTVGTGLMWLASGTYLKDIPDMVEKMAESNPLMTEIFRGDGGQAVVDGFVCIMLLFVALVALGYGISAVLRARTEETAGRTELVLATPVSRTRWLGAQLAVAGLGTTVLMLGGALGLAAGAHSSGATNPDLVTYVGAALTYLPALGVVLGLTAVLFAWAPRWGAAPWACLVVAFVVGMFGQALKLPGWVQGLSPLWWVPQMPVDDFAWPPVLGLTALAAALFALAFVGFRRRDIPVT